MATRGLALRWELWDLLGRRSPAPPPPPPTWQAEVAALRTELRTTREVYEAALAEERRERQQLAEDLGRVNLVCDSLMRQVEAWQQLDESKAATITAMRGELDALRAELAALRVEVPEWRARVQRAELLVALWQRHCDTLEATLRRADVAVPARPAELDLVI